MNRTLSRNLATWLNLFLVVTLLGSLLLPVHLVSASSSRSNSVTSALSLQINPPELEANPVATIDPTMNVKAVDMGEEELYSSFSPLSVARNKSHFSPPLADDPLPSQKLTADDGVAGDWFGYGAAVSENYAVVGAPRDDDQGGNAGSAYVFKRNAENSFWSQVSKLYGTDTNAGDEFGSSVAISGDHMIIGAPKVYIQYPIEGAVYFFKRNPETDSWVQIDQEVTAGGSYSYFGWSVAISGDYAIVGKRINGAYLFHYDGASWSQVGDARLTTIGGTSVAISGDYAIVGAPNAGSGGTAYIFHNDGGSWTQVGNPLAGSNTNGGDGFGQSVAISGDYALIGAPYAEPEATYVFKRNPDTGNWEEVDILTSSYEGPLIEYFGHSVAISGESSIVGVGTDQCEAAYIFGRNPGTGDWDQQHVLTDTNDVVYSYFGRSVGISGEHAIVGAYNDNQRGNEAGAAYIFQIDTTPPPLTLDVLDAQGNPVTQLITNTDGWPTPNPLQVRMTITNTTGATLANPALALTINSPYDLGYEGRFYVMETSGFDQGIYGAFGFQYRVITGTPALAVGQTTVLTAQVWVQPSITTTLSFTAELYADADTVGPDNLLGQAGKQVSVPQAKIHPVGLLEGFFGFNENFVAKHFEPLIDTLEKVGYQRNQTLFVGKYDFIGDVSDAAEELSDQLIEWQATARQVEWVNKFPNEQEGFFDLIALSQGTLVARTYVQTGSYPVDIHRLLLIGAPNRGAPYAYRAREGLEADAGLWQLGLDYAIPLQALECGQATIVMGPSGPVRIYLDTSDRYQTLHNVECGILFLPQILPAPPDNLAYLFNDSGPYPYSRQANPLLEARPQESTDDLWWSLTNPNPTINYLNLNSLDGLAELSNRINGLNNLYLFYNDGIQEAQGYKVEPNTGVEPLWRNGRVIDPGSFLGPSDTSVPFYSARAADLWPDSSGQSLNVPDIPGQERDEIHANLPVYPESQQKIARVLIGSTPPFTTPLNALANYIQTGEVTGGLLKDLAGIFITGMSPLKLFVVDPMGRRLGYDSATGQIINEIPTGVYDHPSGGTANLWIFDPLSGNYNLTITGTGSGNYTILAQFIDLQGSAPIFYKKGTTQLGESQAVTLTIPSNSGEVTYPAIFAFQEIDEQVVMESEHFTEYAVHGARPWVAQSNIAGYVGTGYLDAPLDTDLQFTAAYTSTSPELRYTVNFTTTGIYYVWLRGYASNAGGDTIHVGLDKQPVASLTGFTPREWSWASTNMTEGGRAAIVVAQPGLHTIHFWMREDGFKLDRILLTTNSSYNPVGNGPVESERSYNSD